MPSKPLDSPSLLAQIPEQHPEPFTREELQAIRDKSRALFAVAGRPCYHQFCSAVDVLDAFLARDLLDADESPA